MKRNSISARLLVLLLLPGIFGCQMKTKGLEGSITPREEISREQSNRSDGLTPAVLKDQNDKIAYSIGLDAGTDLEKLDLNAKSIDLLVLGIRDSLEGNEPLLTVEERQQVRNLFVAERLAARSKQLGPEAEKNLAEGEQFLRENGKKEGVVSLPSGLQYRVLKEGTGASPKPDQSVKAHYVIRSIDGSELKNTYKSENPAILPVGGVIRAWAEALQLMKEGDKWELVSPARLAYGEKGFGEAVGPFQALIFELELISIQ